jgi:monoamine oxidase
MLPRRHALKLGLLTLLGITAPRCTQKSLSTSASSAASVVVVGAGIAGLAAASALQRAGLSVIVIESRDRIGGRLWSSTQWPDAVIDLGASWIHGTQNNPLTALAQAAGASTYATEYADRLLYTPQGQVQAARLESLEASEALLDTFLDTLSEELGDSAIEPGSLQAVLDRWIAQANLSPQQRHDLAFWANVTLEHELSGSLKALSATAWDEGEEFGGDEVIFPKGYAQLAQWLSRDLDIRLNHIVQQIGYGEAGVTLVTNQAEFSADYAVITLPLGVLKQKRIQFVPDLPSEKHQAIEQIGMGVLNKTVLRFPRVFWPEVTLFNFVSETTGHWAEWFNLAPALGQPILIGFNAAEFGQQLETWSDQAIVDSAMTVLKHLFGSGIPEPTAWQITRWMSDPFAGGAYSFQAAGQVDDAREVLAQPVANRLFFAGEATSSQYPQTVHGAYLTGLREAEAIIALV